MKTKDKTVAKKIESDIEVVRNALDTIMNDMEIIEKGRDGKPFWNGKNAYTCLRTILKQYGREADLLDKVEDCFSKIEK